MGFSTFHISMSINIAVDTVLFMHLFLRKTVIQPTFKYYGSYNLSNPSLRCFLSHRQNYSIVVSFWDGLQTVLISVVVFCDDLNLLYRKAL